MAIFDPMFQFSGNTTSTGQALTATAASEDILDVTLSDLELGAGESLWLNVRVGVELDSSADGASLTVALVTDTAAPIDGSSIVKFQTAAIEEASLTAGAWILRVPLPVDIDADRIIGLYYTVSGENFTSGSIYAWLDNGSQSSFDTQVTTSNI